MYFDRVVLPAAAAANGGNAYVSEALAYFAAMDVQPNDARKVVINTLIAGLKTDGVWSKLDWLSLFAIGTAQAAHLNAVSPAQEFTVVGTPTFTADDGYLGAAASYLDSNWNPATHGVNYTQNAFSAGAWSLTNSNATTAAMGAVNAGAEGVTLYTRTATDNINGRANSNGSYNVAAPGPTSIGLTAIDRNGSGAGTGEVFRNGVEVGSNVIGTTTAALHTVDFWALGVNNNGALLQPDITRTYAAMFWGGHLTAAEHLALYNRLSTYLTAVGAI